MQRSRLRPGNKSLQNEAGWSILTPEFVFVLVSKLTRQKAKAKSFFKLYGLKRACLPHCYILYLVLMRLGCYS